MKSIHVVSHTHWYREFRWKFEHTRMKLVPGVDHLPEIMRADPHAGDRGVSLSVPPKRAQTLPLTLAPTGEAKP